MDLSLKYRPRSFADLLQPTVAKALSNAIRDGKVSHCYLLSGPKGTGKTTTARLLAASLCCGTPKEDLSACGECDSCRTIINGMGYTDVTEINAAQETGKGDMFDLISSTLNYAPMFAEKKVYILDECHMLSSAAQNSLLKELESPPSYAHFVLCTTEPRKVLPTIIDRSIHFELPPIPSDRIAGRLAAVCSREGIAAEEGALSLIAKEASGSMRRALKLLEKIGGANVTEADAALILGRTGAEAALQVIELLLKGDRGSCFSLLDAADREGKGFSSLFRDAIDVLLDAFRVRLFKGTGCLPGRSEEERGRIVEVAKKLSHRRISELSAVFQDGLAELNRGISPQLSVGIVTISRAGEALMEGTA